MGRAAAFAIPLIVLPLLSVVLENAEKAPNPAIAPMAPTAIALSRSFLARPLLLFPFDIDEPPGL